MKVYGYKNLYVSMKKSYFGSFLTTKKKNAHQTLEPIHI